MSNQDQFFMQRALTLAERGRGQVSPNPMVGCVIVHDGHIIGEGWHQLYGQAHAEVNAVNAVEDKSLLAESTAYVTLEPCSHHGKTPPCADMLVANQLKRVVVAVKDINPLVGGKGIAKMEAGGIAVTYGVLESEAWQLNARFFKSIEQERPYVLLKWAETADGFIARENFDSKWISGVQARQLVHQWRADEDAIMVGTNTARHDNPRLNVRDMPGNDPVRVVIDKQLSLDPGLQLFDGKQPTLCYNLNKSEEQEQLSFIALPEVGFLEALLADLGKRKIQSVLVEGGSTLLNSFINKGLWDEARVFQSTTRFGRGIAAPKLSVQPFAVEQVENDSLSFYYHRS